MQYRGIWDLSMHHDQEKMNLYINISADIFHTQMTEGCILSSVNIDKSDEYVRVNLDDSF